jgi:hypothetical protein
MRTTLLTPLLMAAAVASSGCDKAPVPAAPPAQAIPSGPTSAAGTATLQWGASPDPLVVGYRVYYGTSSRAYQQAKGKGIDSASATTYVAKGLQSGKTYYFAVTEYDAAGNESDFSAEVSKIIP